jgi:hypothetical protein
LKGAKCYLYTILVTRIYRIYKILQICAKFEKNVFGRIGHTHFIIVIVV